MVLWEKWHRKNMSCILNLGINCVKVSSSPYYKDPQKVASDLICAIFFPYAFDKTSVHVPGQGKQILSIVQYFPAPVKQQPYSLTPFRYSDNLNKKTPVIEQICSLVRPATLFLYAAGKRGGL